MNTSALTHTGVHSSIHIGVKKKKKKKKNCLKAEMWSADLKKVFKGLQIDFENPADTRLFYGTIWNNVFFFFLISPF